ncbi:MAG: hypothetical protein V7782_13300 [Psychromonas sp.]
MKFNAFRYIHTFSSFPKIVWIVNMVLYRYKHCEYSCSLVIPLHSRGLKNIVDDVESCKLSETILRQFKIWKAIIELAKSESYQALGEYLSSTTKMDFIGNKNHESSMTPNDFNKGIPCPACARERITAAAIIRANKQISKKPKLRYVLLNI